MKSFKKLVLCEFFSKKLDVYVWADMEDNKLTIAGQDLGPFVEEIFGDSDYEYWYSFDENETEKLLRLIHGLEKPEEALLDAFCGLDGCTTLKAFCKKNNIHYQFYSYA